VVDYFKHNDVPEDLPMQKTLVAGFAFLAMTLFVGNAEACLFKKKVKICSSCKTGSTTTVTAGKAPKSSEKAPAPAPQAVKNEDKTKAPAPAPQAVKNEDKKKAPAPNLKN